APGLAQSQVAPPSPAAQRSAAPVAASAPPANVTWQTNLSGYTFRTDHPNATGALDTPDGKDPGSRTDYGNILVSVMRNTGTFRFGATAGEYTFPVVGTALNPTFKAGANTDLYSYVPIAFVQFVPNDTWTLSAGKLATLIGQESAFTWQNVNIQRGLGWNPEPVVSRGVRAQYTHSRFTGILEYNDGFYSGRLNSLEGSFSFKASDRVNYTLAFILPPSGSTPNPTTSTANKRVLDLMTTQIFGKLTLAPYLQWLESPASTANGFGSDERAFYGVMIANYAFGPDWSLAARYESATNGSGALDASPNADLVGFGPGSAATTFTVTPQFKTGHTAIRAEYSSVNLGKFIPGLGFGPHGLDRGQSRLGLEISAQF
ncbi:MAG: porin, partial [Candidatus Eremiobacteraeota bacterium]|nr:porin [Candidatus Eremiobacteraeota bacterium]